MRKIIFIICALTISAAVFAQEKVTETFSDMRIINGHSTKTLKAREFRYIIEHRFGDIAGEKGGVQTAFGFDNAADIRFGFDFGIKDNWMIGLARSKGTGAPYRSLLDFNTKYKFMQQTKDNSTPISLALVGTAFATYMKAGKDIAEVNSFPKFSHRLAYSAQLVVTRKFGDRLSLAILPTYVHRNYVKFDDQNELFAVGGAINYKLNKSLGIIAEYFQSFNKAGLRDAYKNSLSFALEWITNGHNFHFNFTNARGFGELQYISYTTSDWLKGQFRFGFGISRTFKR